MLRICGHRVKVAELRESVGLPFPDATGQRIYTANGIYSNRAEYLGHAIPGCLLVPSVDGPFFLCFPGSDSPNNRTFDQKPVISVFADDPGHGLAGLDHLPEQFLHVDAHVDAKVYVDPWVYHVAKADVVAMLAISRDAVILRPLKLEDAERRARRQNYLFLASSPPGIVRLGETLRYQLDVRSKAGGVTFKLEAGPKEMSVSDTGLLSWTANTGIGARLAHVVVAASDSSGQSVRQTFDLDLDDGQSDASTVAAAARSEAPQAPSAGPATAKPAEKSGPAAAGQVEFKTVQDSTGKFKVDAAFDGMVDGKVQLKKRDGSTVLVPLEKLSAADQDWAKQQRAAPGVLPEQTQPKTDNSVGHGSAERGAPSRTLRPHATRPPIRSNTLSGSSPKPGNACRKLKPPRPAKPWRKRSARPRRS